AHLLQEDALMNDILQRSPLPLQDFSKVAEQAPCLGVDPIVRRIVENRTDCEAALHVRRHVPQRLRQLTCLEINGGLGTEEYELPSLPAQRRRPQQPQPLEPDLFDRDHLSNFLLIPAQTT